MSDVLKDPKVMEGLINGHAALIELLNEFDEGAWIHKPHPDGGQVDVKADDLDRVVDALVSLREALRVLIIQEQN